MASKTHAAGWRYGDDGYLALGRDPESMPVYRVVGPIARPDGLYLTKMRFPSCLRFQVDVDPVLDPTELTRAEAKRYRSKIVTRQSRLGP